MLRYSDAIELLINEFAEMKTAYDNDQGEDYGAYEHSQFALYEDEFTPYILVNLREMNKPELKKIFSFVEILFENGDDSLINLVAVAVVEALYLDEEFEEYKDTIFAICGEKTRQSFEEGINWRPE
jgi:hypothetical protein